MMTKKVAPFVEGRLTNSLTQIDYWEVCCMTHFPFFFSQMKEDIPEYFLSVKHLWVDKDLKPTTEWAKAEFIMEGSLPVRMAKPGSFYAWVHELRKTE